MNESFVWNSVFSKQNIVIFCIRRNCKFFQKIAIFEQNLKFSTKFEFLTKIPIFDQNPDFSSKFRFWEQKFNFLSKMGGQNFGFSKEFPISNQNFDLRTKIWFLVKIPSVCSKFRILEGFSLAFFQYFFEKVFEFLFSKL